MKGHKPWNCLYVDGIKTRLRDWGEEMVNYRLLRSIEIEVYPEGISGVPYTQDLVYREIRGH